MYVLINPGVESPRTAERLAGAVAGGLRRYGYTTTVIRDRRRYTPGHYLLELQTVSMPFTPFARVLTTTYQVTTGSSAPVHQGRQSRSSSVSRRRLVRGIAELVAQDVGRGLSTQPR